MSLSDKIIQRIARKDKEDPFMETIIKANDVREAVKALRERLDSVEDPCEFDVTGFGGIIYEIFGPKLTIRSMCERGA